MSTAAQADPTNARLTAQVATLFKGETLRGLLLYAWGWSVVSTIALYAWGWSVVSTIALDSAFAAQLGFLIMAVVTIGDFVADPRVAARHIPEA